MKILGPWNPSPFPPTNSLKLEWQGGDFIFPLFGNWFTPPYFKRVIRFYVSWRILPYVSWRYLGKFGGYFGAKSFGVDSEAYKNWLPEADVYDGSRAIMLSVRPFARIDNA